MSISLRINGRLARFALAALVASVLLLGLGTPRASATVQLPAAPSVPAGGVCSFLPGGLGDILCNHTIDHALKSVIGNAVGHAVGSTLGGVAGGVIGNLGNSFFGAADGVVRTGAIDLLGWISKLISHVQTPNLQSSWFLSLYGQVVGLTLGVILFLMYIFRIASTVGRSNWVREVAEATVALVVAVVAMFLIVYVFQLSLFFADKLTTVISSGQESTFTALQQKLLSQSSGSVWIDLVEAGLMFLLALLLWIELLVRSVCMYAGLAVAPLAFSARTMGEWGNRITWRLIVFMLALVFSLPLMVMMLALGMGAISHIPSYVGPAKVTVGIIFLFFALITPWPIVAWTQRLQATVVANNTARAASASAAHSGGRSVPSHKTTSSQIQTNLGKSIAEPSGSLAHRTVGRVARIPGATLAATAIGGPEAGAVVSAVRTQQRAAAAKRIEAARNRKGLNSG